MDDEEEVLIRVKENLLSEDIWVLIPPRVWDADNLAEGIKKAILMAIGQIPDQLDG